MGTIGAAGAADTADAVEGPDGWGGTEGDGEDAGAGATVVRLTGSGATGGMGAREASEEVSTVTSMGMGRPQTWVMAALMGARAARRCPWRRPIRRRGRAWPVDVDEVGHADHGHLALPQLSGAGEHLKG